MIIKYIIFILKNDDSVYINGLGLFEKKMISANVKNGVITPPHYKIVFDANGEGNGFAFILKYAEREQKRLNDADSEITQWVNELKNGILNNKSIEIEEFGVFSKNNKEEIIFDSAWIRELNIEYEGMEALKVENGNIESEDRKQEHIEEVAEKDQRGKVEESEKEEREKEEREEPVVKEVIEEEREIPLAVEEVQGDEEVDANEGKMEEEKEEKEELVVEEEITEREGVENDEIIENEESEDDIKKKKRKWPWILLIIILLLIPAGYFGYESRVELELVYKEYKHKLLGDKKTYYKRQIGDYLYIIPKENRPGYRQVGHLDIPFIHENENLKIDEESFGVEGEVIEDIAIEDIESKMPATPAKEPVSTVQQANYMGSQVNVVTSPSSTVYPKIEYQKGNFYVIAGSFVNEQDAAKHIDDTKLTGLNPYLLYQTGNNRVRVCIGIFSSSKIAEEYATSFNKSYWVLQ
ncbi:hypothetical protein LJC68_03255 [Bacteroidales bacterium OttesenSCG-928-B11]|nr:hypothetical protein [Bacteroidales bacterium OttesenSCG-928-C03]MDL2311877.1 hypothetical protein [Bacteroidales bacterium OttesenSCG-928-B11]MDL2326166.1 hypothetical protein [Bacteroidales bacterium OttesenSCG-928-A14]